MTIIDNAIRSIQVGVEDYENGGAARLQSAVRNLAAGLLLLYKEGLIRHSPADQPDLLIKSNLILKKKSDGSVTVVGKGRTTVNVQQIKERFKEFGIQVDWVRLDSIVELRNDIEHYYTSESEAVVLEVVSKSFILIRDFLVEVLGERPVELLGADCWNALLRVNELYDSEKSIADQEMGQVDWVYSTMHDCVQYFRCVNCRSSLISPIDDDRYHSDFQLKCVTCGNNFSTDDVIENCVCELLAGEAYIAATDGGQTPYEMCHNCNRETYIVNEAVCIACDHGFDYVECIRCGDSLSSDEQESNGLCSYCAHMADKVMNE